MTSKLRIDEIVDSTDTGSPAFPLGVTTTALSYTGTLTGSTGVINIGSGQIYKDASGNVGIGTSSPLGYLTVASQNRFVTIGDSGVNNVAQIRASNADGSSDAFFNIRGFELNFLAGGSERARIDASGNFLVGTTTNDASGASDSTTGVSIGANSTIANKSTSGLINLILNRSDGASGTVASFRTNGGTRGSISVTTSSTSYNTSSDYRLKEDAQPVLNPIDRLMQLKPINFAWKVDGTRVDGFLAHEAQTVVPEAVTGEKDAVDKDGKPEYQGIDQSKLVPLLTAALQDAVKRIEQLEAQLNSGV